MNYRRLRWIILGLLFLASAINYLDRQTLASASARVKSEFGLVNEQYGDVEAAFGYGFVLGSVLFGFLADVVSIRWLYPAVLLAWSAATAGTALVLALAGGAELKVSTAVSPVWLAELLRCLG